MCERQTHPLWPIASIELLAREGGGGGGQAVDSEPNVIYLYHRGYGKPPFLSQPTRAFCSEALLPEAQREHSAVVCDHQGEGRKAQGERDGGGAVGTAVIILRPPRGVIALTAYCFLRPGTKIWTAGTIISGNLVSYVRDSTDKKLKKKATLQRYGDTTPSHYPSSQQSIQRRFSYHQAVLSVVIPR